MCAYFRLVLSLCMCVWDLRNRGVVLCICPGEIAFVLTMLLSFQYLIAVCLILKDQISLCILVSSANIDTVEHNKFGTSLTNSVNSVGPRTVP